MNSESVRLGKNFKDFINKIKINRIKSDVDDCSLSSVGVANLIVKYFKLNNLRYLELLKMVDTND
jgi:hypothetical protein